MVHYFTSVPEMTYCCCVEWDHWDVKHRLIHSLIISRKMSKTD